MHATRRPGGKLRRCSQHAEEVLIEVAHAETKLASRVRDQCPAGLRMHAADPFAQQMVKTGALQMFWPFGH